MFAPKIKGLLKPGPRLPESCSSFSPSMLQLHMNKKHGPYLHMVVHPILLALEKGDRLISKSKHPGLQSKMLCHKKLKS
jgi:hypothetical protein